MQALDQHWSAQFNAEHLNCLETVGAALPARIVPATCISTTNESSQQPASTTDKVPVAKTVTIRDKEGSMMTFANFDPPEVHALLKTHNKAQADGDVKKIQAQGVVDLKIEEAKTSREQQAQQHASQESHKQREHNPKEADKQREHDSKEADKQREEADKQREHEINMKLLECGTPAQKQVALERMSSHRTLDSVVPDENLGEVRSRMFSSPVFLRAVPSQSAVTQSVKRRRTNNDRTKKKVRQPPGNLLPVRLNRAYATVGCIDVTVRGKQSISDLVNGAIEGDCPMWLNHKGEHASTYRCATCSLCIRITKTKFDPTWLLIQTNDKSHGAQCVDNGCIVIKEGFKYAP